MDSLKYITVAGDTYDSLALDAYNNEFLAHIIADANPDYAGVILFDAGVCLSVPIIAPKVANPAYPPWRR